MILADQRHGGTSAWLLLKTLCYCVCAGKAEGKQARVKGRRWGQCCGILVKIPPATPASYLKVHIPAPSLPTQIPTNGLGKGVKDDASVWAPAARMGDPDEALGFSWTQS